jgi:hypothetical protein
VPETYEDAVREAVARRKPQGVAAAPQQVIAVLTPTLGQISMWWHTALCDLLWPMNTGKAMVPSIDREGGEIAEVRNRLVNMMLAAETEGMKIHSLFWVDDDVIINRAAMLALASHDRPIASGVYFAKGDFSCPLIFDGPNSGTHPFCPDEKFEAWGWAQGLSLVRMDVYRQMRDELNMGTDKYGAPLWYEPGDFKVNKDGGLLIGGTEDFPFFQKANDLGYRALVDCTQFAFGWHYDSFQGVGYPRQQWEQFVRREPVIWPAKGERPEVVWKP